jgi:hypothetical protein
LIITREILSLSNPSFRNIPDTTVEDTARRQIRFAPRPVGQRSRSRKANLRAARAARAEREKQARKKREAALLVAFQAKERKEEEFEIKMGGTEDILVPTTTLRTGATARALRRARKRGQLRTVSRTAKRRGRTIKETVLKVVKRKVKGESCSFRPNRDAAKVTSSEATCEVLKRGIQRRGAGQLGDLRRIGIDARAIPINSEREARLLLKANRKKLLSEGVDPLIFGQANRGLAISFPTKQVRIGSGRTSRLVSRTRLSGGDLVRNQSRRRLLFLGATRIEVEAVISRDKRNEKAAKRQSAGLRSGGARFGVAKTFFASGGQRTRANRFGIGPSGIDERTFVRSGFGTKQDFKNTVIRANRSGGLPTGFVV